MPKLSHYNNCNFARLDSAISILYSDNVAIPRRLIMNHWSPLGSYGTILLECVCSFQCLALASWVVGRCCFCSIYRTSGLDDLANPSRRDSFALVDHPSRSRTPQNKIIVLFPWIVSLPLYCRIPQSWVCIILVFLSSYIHSRKPVVFRSMPTRLFPIRMCSSVNNSHDYQSYHKLNKS